MAISVSSPTMSLRKGAHCHDSKSPLSSTSSVFTLSHVNLHSPPPSPGLPSMIPRRRRRPSGGPRPSRVFRTLLWISGVLLLFYCTSYAIGRNRIMPWATWHLQNAGDVEYEMVAQEDFPDFVTPIAVTDKGGVTKWTFWTPPRTGFPLGVREFADMGGKCREVAQHVRDVTSRGKKKNEKKVLGLGLGYPSWFGGEDVDANFVDVMEAQSTGMLPPRMESLGIEPGNGMPMGLVGINRLGNEGKTVCKKSMTLVLESSNAGIGNTIMLLWMTYGLAQTQGRSFFIDDSRWLYGNYTDIFAPPPVPDCRPPPTQEMVPCPHHARHLVVTTATAKDILEVLALSKEFDDHMKMELYRQQQMFGLARKGYEGLFKLNPDDSKYVTKRMGDFDKKTMPSTEGMVSDDAAAKDYGGRGVLVGVHVRRGDCHPLEYQYHDSYIPLNYYRDAVTEVLERKLNTTTSKSPWGKGKGGADKEARRQRSYVVLASDDPTVYDAEEFGGSLRAQGYINLASKSAIERAKQKKNGGAGGGNEKKSWIEEEFGWEGGFFGSMFLNLGSGAKNAKGAGTGGEGGNGEVETRASPETVRMRSLLGRAYMMDLAVLSKKSDAVVCAVSAMGCRLVAVMMGWDRAIVQRDWVNIDGGFGWTGVTTW